MNEAEMDKIVALSRRAAGIQEASTWKGWASPTAGLEYARAVTAARGEFKNLPKKWQRFIEKYEKVIEKDKKKRERELKRAVGSEGDKFVSEEKDYVTSPSQCQQCKHRLPGYWNRCEAYPDGIPMKILANLVDHQKPYPGDHGIRYEPLKDTGSYQLERALAKAAGADVVLPDDDWLKSRGA